VAQINNLHLQIEQ